ncbi:site-specific integrase [Peribacillus loiseleuriae]|uniref:Integrase n=1 Tax=Peribacillus loiseleuriae TaxID=1679170 RepID=A0A0K9GS75_9BACI|nr:site-specific integrase [Peribacillus loiseleuriae]KMY49534.1 integrase [Peribacillus loiseleuriae]
MATFHKYKKKGSNKDFWEYRIYYQDPITRKTREKSKRGFLGKTEAKLAAENEERRIREGLEITDESLKIWLETWLLEYKKGTVAKNTFEIHERNVKNHIIPYFKNILLKDVKPLMYQKFINHLTKLEYSKRTVEIVHGTMFNSFEKAKTLGKIEKNPCVGVEIKGEKKEQELQFIESEHISDFLKASYEYGYIYWMFYKLLIETGMRKGEAAALQWMDVDLKEQTININKSLDFKEASKNPDEMFGNVKTYHSKRVITISQALANDLRFHQKYQNQNKTILNENYHFDLNLVLCRDDGNYMPKSSLFNSFSRILKKCGLSSLPIHSLRHTHAVLQLEAGTDMKYLQERLGHGSMQITADVYSHISKTIEKDRMNKFEEYMKNVLE